MGGERDEARSEGGGDRAGGAVRWLGDIGQRGREGGGGVCGMGRYGKIYRKPARAFTYLLYRSYYTRSF